MATSLQSQNTQSYWQKGEELDRKWFLLDAQDVVLGRLSTRIAMILMGKTKPTYTPSVDNGDFVIVTNVDKIRLTGNKLNQKHLFHHTAWPGGARVETYKKLITENPEKMLQQAVKRMLPKNKLASRQILRMKMFRGSSHPHASQNPRKLERI
jgi:large subunit ribosomal protein L13